MINIKTAVKESGGSKTYVIEAYYKLRKMCALKLLDISRPIGGEGGIVEVEETQFYGAKFNVGRRLGTGRFIGGIDRHDNSKIFLVQVPNRKAINTFYQEQPYFLDCWRSYNGITNLESGYTHLTVKHRLNFVNPRDRLAILKTLNICGG
ncbi:hypothetical protein RF11_14832 [Thelohanellus kitauei]|uniref:ISXO2-like transposase domain-containing protein n=1 Tax=Thelohanellus kitauei TaxID=669202 RepID=A0A0C2JMB7_THEKT|nr:hypothetical protein RF11_14832 [Thelohanellus kitauei]